MFRARTNRGRVVYDRKPHYWTVADLNRIVKSIISDMVAEDIFSQFIGNASIFMLEQVLGKVGLARFAKIAYTYLLGMIGWLMDRLGLDLGLEFGRRIFAKLTEYYSAEELGKGIPV